MRVVCANTLEIGLRQGDNSGRIVRVRHTSKASERIKEAADILKMRNTAAEELARQGEWLVEQSMDDGQFAKFLDDLMPVDEDQQGTPAGTMITNRRASISRIYLSAPNLEPIRGTRWGAFNAVAEYSDHVREFKTQETHLKAAFGFTASPIKTKAAELLLV
jgi:phage/plasmid-like protein (TIGR03299 family)